MKSRAEIRLGSAKSGRSQSIQLWAVVCVGIAVSIGLFYLVRNWESRSASADFAFLAESHDTALQKEIRQHIELFDSINSFYRASTYVDRNEFHTFVTRLMTQDNAILTLAWIPKVSAVDRRKFIAQARRDGLKDFRIQGGKKAQSGNMAGSSEALFPLFYVETATQQQKLLGFDLGSVPNFRQAMMRACDSGEIAATGRIPLGEGPSTRYGVGILQPVYRKGADIKSRESRRQNLSGYLYELLDIGRLVGDAVVSWGIFNVDIAIVDQSAPAGHRLLFNYDSTSRKVTPASGVNPMALGNSDLYWRSSISIPGRNWLLVMKPGSAFVAKHSSRESWLSLVVGLMLTAILWLLMQATIRRNLKIEVMAGNLVRSNDHLEKQIERRRKIEAAVKQSRRMLQLVLDTIPVRVFWKDDESRYLGCNRRFAKDAGLDSPRSIIGKTDHELAWQHDAELYRRDDLKVIDSGQEMIDFEEPQTGVDGNIRWLRTSKIPLKDLNNQVIGVLGAYDDITEQRQAIAKMRRLSGALEQTADAVVISTKEGIIEYVNPAFEKITGYSRAEALGQKTSIIKSDRHDRDFYQNMWETILSGKVYRDVMVNRRKDGTLYYEEKSITPLLDEQGQVVNFISTGMDITKRMEAEERLHHLAYHDVLTDMPNRALFMERLSHALSRRYPEDYLIAILFLDIDRFKNINDTLGHDSGDRLLQSFSHMLLKCVREGDTVARLGGDEFAILLEGVSSMDAATHVAEKIKAALLVPFKVEGPDLFVTTSIGVSLYPYDGVDTATLLKHADAAMYRAKDMGRNNYQFYSNEMSTQALKRLTMENSLHHALELKQFFLLYQPQVDINSGKIVGAEVLMRWQHPELGLVSPDEFIPLLEETGLIVPVGAWVLQEACQKARLWNDRYDNNFRMSVNISGRQFNEEKFSLQIEHLLRGTGLAPCLLELEITENVLMQNDQSSMNNLNTLHDIGIRLSIDDFGTGYSSLSYLKRFPVDVLKIDKSFVSDITSDPDDATIVSAIAVMAHRLNLQVIAEGVETEEQLEFLRHCSCDVIQGYLFSRPVESTVLEKMLAQGSLGNKKMNNA